MVQIDNIAAVVVILVVIDGCRWHGFQIGCGCITVAIFSVVQINNIAAVVVIVVVVIDGCRCHGFQIRCGCITVTIFSVGQIDNIDVVVANVVGTNVIGIAVLVDIFAGRLIYFRRR